VHRHVSQQAQPPSAENKQTRPSVSREDRKVGLTPVQTQMFKLMTRALSIPHFLYTCAADMGQITSMRKRLNGKAVGSDVKLTHLPFVVKAVSLALLHHPLLNASLNTKDANRPELTYRGEHNIGVAIDAPSGLLVPVLKGVQDMTIVEIASKVQDLADRARNNKLAPSDFQGATFTMSNIGSIGGGVVAPVISEPQVAILGIGRSKIVPAFDENEQLVKREELVFSWSADHRVVDGAECARCAERVKSYLEDPGSMAVAMR
jgi:2-oxoisovalerate dehydrogenase E2 component (dihydrolipoyl transacylase)